MRKDTITHVQDGKVMVHTPMDYFKAEMFLIAHSWPNDKIGDWLQLKCICDQGDYCPLTEADLWFLAKGIWVPEYLMEEFKEECGNLVSGLWPSEGNSLAWNAAHNSNAQKMEATKWNARTVIGFLH